MLPVSGPAVGLVALQQYFVTTPMQINKLYYRATNLRHKQAVVFTTDGCWHSLSPLQNVQALLLVVLPLLLLLLLLPCLL